MTWIDIPDKWTGDQALAVVEFLDEISAMIWSKHELKMLDAYHERYSKIAPDSEEADNVNLTTKSATTAPKNTDDFPF